jgi:hypothetical protein
MPTQKQKYRCNTGLNYPPDNRRAEPGEIVDDIPEVSAGWLLEDGLIEAVDDSTPLGLPKPPQKTKEGGAI